MQADLKVGLYGRNIGRSAVYDDTSNVEADLQVGLQ
jgi:hypothetical protein